MLIQQRTTVSVSPQTAWPFFRDIPAVAGCVPGVEHVEATAPDSYRGVMALRVGPLALKLSGTAVVETWDDATHQLILSVKAEDKRVASATEARVTVQLEGAEDGSTLLCVDADTTVRGKLGQFGQSMIKHAADDVLRRFAACLSERLRGGRHSVA